MKSLALLFLIIGFVGCKKQKVDDITKYDWKLETAIVSPGRVFQGKAETNYMKSDPSSCLQNNFAIVFSENGSYGYASNGPLCDMAANDGSMKWEMKDEQIFLTNSKSNQDTIVASLKGNKLTYTTTFSDAGTSYNIVWTFMGKSK